MKISGMIAQGRIVPHSTLESTILELEPGDIIHSSEIWNCIIIGGKFHACRFVDCKIDEQYRTWPGVGYYEYTTFKRCWVRGITTTKEYENDTICLKKEKAFVGCVEHFLEMEGE